MSRRKYRKSSTMAYRSSLLGELADEQRRLVDIALPTIAAIQTGSIATRGATASALVGTLTQMRDLVERVLPEIRLKTLTTTPPRQ